MRTLLVRRRCSCLVALVLLLFPIVFVPILVMWRDNVPGSRENRRYWWVLCATPAKGDGRIERAYLVDWRQTAGGAETVSPWGVLGSVRIADLQPIADAANYERAREAIDELNAHLHDPEAILVFPSGQAVTLILMWDLGGLSWSYYRVLPTGGVSFKSTGHLNLFTTVMSCPLGIVAGLGLLALWGAFLSVARWVLRRRSSGHDDGPPIGPG